MGEVRYSVNGKYFRDWKVFVSDSEGLFDALKRKKVNSYQWAEYHGQSVDLSNPKYEAREITLKCFVVGDNWVAMKANFDVLVSEFQKSGTQRLLIEPFGLKPLPYEVYMEDSSELQKTFREGKMAGVFTLKLIEPNPIKKVFKNTSDVFSLAFKSEYDAEIFWGDGTKSVASGDVNITKDYNYPIYQPSGYSLVTAENEGNFEYYQAQPVFKLQYYQFSAEVNFAASQNVTFYLIGKKNNNTYELIQSVDISVSAGLNTLKVISEINIGDYKRFVLKVLDANGAEMAVTYSNVRMEAADVNGDWYDVTGQEKLIIIAGNVEEITGLTTNAEVIWEKL